MWPYWLLFVFPALMALQERSRFGFGMSQSPGSRSGPVWKFFFVFLALFVGYRHEVGGDWPGYLINFNRSMGEHLLTVLKRGDPGYQFLEWSAHSLGLGIHSVNLVCGVIFAAGLVRFCLNLPRPWLAMVVAVPYLIIVLGMGYGRQGVALSCIMSGLVYLGRGKVKTFVALAIVGATFHKSGILVLPMAALAASENRLYVVSWVGLISIIAYSLFVEDSMAALRYGYIDERYQSQGAFVRLSMNAVPAAILILFLRRFSLNLPQQRLWYWYSIFALLAFLALPFVASSTALDRMALYLLPLQLVVFSYFPEVIGSRKMANLSLVGLIIVGYAVVQFVWFAYGNFSASWLPYQFYPLTNEFLRGS